MLPDITNYIPDPNNGRPIANGQVYFFIDGYTPPTNINDVNPAYVAEVTAGGAVLPQPIYTTQGGVLRAGSLSNMPQVNVSTLVKRVAVYDKCGTLIYSTAYNGVGAFVDVDALAATDSDVLVGGVEAGKLRDYKSALDFESLVVDDDWTSAIQAALDASLKVIIPEKGSPYFMSSYVNMRDNHNIIIDGYIVQLESNTPLYHPAGFTADRKENITISGTGMFSSEALLLIPEATFPINTATGYTPVIHLRSCKDCVITGQLRQYKLTAGWAATKYTEPCSPIWEFTNFSEPSENIYMHGSIARYVNFFSCTILGTQGGAMNNNYCYRAGDSGLHVMFSQWVSVLGNHRESPYGDGSDQLDPLVFNDCQGISIEGCQYCIVADNIVKGLMTNPIDIKNNCVDILVTNNYIHDAQLAGITVRGGDTVYGLNTSIQVTGNHIKNTGYLHSSNTAWVNHPFRGAIFVQDTYSATVTGNHIVGLNSTYAYAVIRADGVNLDDLGFWTGVEGQVSITSIDISNNNFYVAQVRSNYPDTPTTFQAGFVNGRGIDVTGIWGSVSLRSNVLHNNLFGNITQVVDEQAAIMVATSGAGDGGEASSQVISVSGNDILNWNGGGIFVNGGNKDFIPATVVEVSGNNIARTSHFGIMVSACNRPSIIGNSVQNSAFNELGIYRFPIGLYNSNLVLLSNNSARNTTDVNDYLHGVYADGTTIVSNGNVISSPNASIFTLVNSSAIVAFNEGSDFRG